MIVMPSNATGWFIHSLARETGRLGHLHSPGHQRGPWPWLPYALDNGAFSCWKPKINTFDFDKWKTVEASWRRLLFWAQTNLQRPLWSIVPDVPGNADATLQQWSAFASIVQECGIPLALAVQNGMSADDVRALDPAPAVICVGGTTEWKWETVEMWAREFRRVHLLRCNAPTRLDYLLRLGVESTDGTGWARGDRTQTRGLEEWCFQHAQRLPKRYPLWTHTCRNERKANRQLRGQPIQEVFA